MRCYECGGKGYVSEWEGDGEYSHTPCECRRPKQVCFTYKVEAIIEVLAESRFEAEEKLENEQWDNFKFGKVEEIET